MMAASAHTNPTTQMHERIKRINRCDCECECECGRKSIIKVHVIIDIPYRASHLLEVGPRVPIDEGERTQEEESGEFDEM